MKLVYHARCRITRVNKILFITGSGYWERSFLLENRGWWGDWRGGGCCGDGLRTHNLSGIHYTNHFGALGVFEVPASTCFGFSGLSSHLILTYSDFLMDRDSRAHQTTNAMLPPSVLNYTTFA